MSTADALMEIVRFIHYMDASNLTESVALDLIESADYFGMVELKDRSEEFLLCLFTDLSIQNHVVSLAVHFTDCLISRF